MYAILKTLQSNPALLLTDDNNPLTNFTRQCLCYRLEGEAFRRDVYAALEKGNSEPLLQYLFLRDRMFDGEEFGLLQDGLRIISFGKPHEATLPRYGVATHELADVEVRSLKFATALKVRLNFDRNGNILLNRNNFGHDRFHALRYPSSLRFFRNEPDQIRKLYLAFFNWMVQLRKMDLLDRVDRIPASAEGRSHAYAALDAAAANGQLPAFLENLIYWVDHLPSAAVPEDKFMLHSALAAIPYALDKGYISAQKHPELAGRCLRALMLAMDKEFLGFWDLENILHPHGGAFLQSMFESLIQSANGGVQAPIIWSLGHIAQNHADRREQAVTMLLNLLEHHPSLQPQNVLIALIDAFAGQGMRTNPRRIFDPLASSSEYQLRERVIQLLIDQLNSRANWRKHDHRSLADEVASTVANLADIRCVGPLLKYEADSIAFHELGENFHRFHEEGPIISLIDKIPSIDLALYVLHEVEYQTYFHRWRQWIFTRERRGNMESDIKKQDPDLWRRFLVFLRGEKPEDATEKPKAIYQDGISYALDIYGILGVKADLPRDAIRSAYRSLAKLLHPDSMNGSRPDTWVERLKLVPPRVFESVEKEYRGVLCAIQEGRGAEILPETAHEALAAIMRLFNEAYRIIYDEGLRSAYDEFSPFGTKARDQQMRSDAGTFNGEAALFLAGMGYILAVGPMWIALTLMAGLIAVYTPSMISRSTRESLRSL